MPPEATRPSFASLQYCAVYTSHPQSEREQLSAVAHLYDVTARRPEACDVALLNTATEAVAQVA